MCIISRCFDCKHFHRKIYTLEEPYTCDAFQKKIPGWLLLHAGDCRCTEYVYYESEMNLHYKFSSRHCGWPRGIITLGLDDEEVAELEKNTDLRAWEEKG